MSKREIKTVLAHCKLVDIDGFYKSDAFDNFANEFLREHEGWEFIESRVTDRGVYFTFQRAIPVN
jgi:hypothetical protein